MIIKFENFLNEYRGPYGTVGFRYSTPTDEYTLDLNMKYTQDNENVIKNALSKYDISYKDIKIERPYFGALQTLKLKFVVYSELEAVSVINSILSELKNNNIFFEEESINIFPKIEQPFRRKEIKGFRG